MSPGPDRRPHAVALRHEPDSFPCELPDMEVASRAESTRSIMNFDKGICIGNTGLCEF